MNRNYALETSIDEESLKGAAKFIRLESLKMIYESGIGHLGSEMSVAEILSVLYLRILRLDPENPDHEDRDRFILSKAHSSAALYSALHLKGFLKYEELSSYIQPFSRLGAVVSNRVPGVEACTGALGHGLPIAVGEAIAAKQLNSNRKVFALMGDGETQEGTTWEAAMLASTYNLDNLTLIIDRNKLQKGSHTEKTNQLEPLNDKWTAFGWGVEYVDGHDVMALLDLFLTPTKNKKPRCVIAETVKGKGVSYMEDSWQWHNQVPTDSEYLQAVEEIKGDFL